jgi:hypothetical protein
MPATSGTLTRVQSLKLDGAVYASPIVVRGLTIVATEADTVYAFDRSYRQVWKRNLGSPSPAEERQCGNIDPLGITGTRCMTLDLATFSWWPSRAVRCATSCTPWTPARDGWPGAGAWISPG